VSEEATKIIATKLSQEMAPTLCSNWFGTDDFAVDPFGSSNRGKKTGGLKELVELRRFGAILEICGKAKICSTRGKPWHSRETEWHVATPQLQGATHVRAQACSGSLFRRSQCETLGHRGASE
jgi:hypothetical protein